MLQTVAFILRIHELKNIVLFFYNLNFQEHSSIIPDLSNVLMVQINLLGFSPDLKFILKNQISEILYYIIQFRF